MIIVHTEIGPVGSPSLNCLDFTESREHSDPIWTLVHFLLLPQEIHTLFYFPSYFSPLLSSSPPLTKIAVSLLTVIISPHLEILDTFHLPRRAPTLLPLSTPLPKRLRHFLSHSCLSRIFQPRRIPNLLQMRHLITSSTSPDSTRLSPIHIIDLINQPLGLPFPRR